ncbi:MAG: response regulator, partial [Vicinamibacterales bacterium]
MTRIRTLIVEDELIIARDIERQLIALGHHPVGMATSGEEAMALAASLQPQLVLMDIHLSGQMDG